MIPMMADLTALKGQHHTFVNDAARLTVSQGAFCMRADAFSSCPHALLRIGKPDFSPMRPTLLCSTVRDTVECSIQADLTTQIKRIDHSSAAFRMHIRTRAYTPYMCIRARELDYMMLSRRQQTLLLIEKRDANWMALHRGTYRERNKRSTHYYSVE